MNNILIASPVNKDAKILAEFLRSVKRLHAPDCHIFYCFVDDNDDTLSHDMLMEFVDKEANAVVLDIDGLYKNTALEKIDHFWSRQKIDKLAAIKNRIISYFLKGSFSHLFFVDADIVLHPNTLVTLLDSDKDIVANIFWTKWQENSAELPQVWLKDFYTLYDDDMTQHKTGEQINAETAAFLNMLRKPGLYRVGGLGACTLIRQKVLAAGVNFSPVYNLSFWGEDRSFCVRAAVMGFLLYVNTYYPAHHIYRIKDLERIPNWHKNEYE